MTADWRAITVQNLTSTYFEGGY